MQTSVRLALLCLTLVLGTGFVSAQDPSVNTIFVINAPSTASRGVDSILTLNSHGKSVVFLGTEHNFSGLTDIACQPDRPRNVIVPHSVFPVSHGFLILNAKGRIIHTIPSGPPGGGVSIAYDRVGTLYVVDGVTRIVFKNDIALATLPLTGIIGRIVVDSLGNIYVTDSTVFAPQETSRVFRVDQAGNVSVFADETKGLNRPFGLAVDSQDNVFVANNPPGAAGFILKFDPSGTASFFATDIASQPDLRSMVFDDKDNLYVTLGAYDTILKFTTAGASTVFADASDGLNYPTAITMGCH